MAEFKLGRIRFVWKGDWAPSTTYYVDDVIRYGGRTYICSVGHTSALDFYTDLDFSPTKWNQMSDGQEWRGDWTISTFYKEQDIVKYGANLYICTDSHTSNSATDSGVAGEETATGIEANETERDIIAEGLDWKGDLTPNTRYKENDLVKYGGYTYVAVSGHYSSADITSGLEAQTIYWQTFNQGLDYKGDWVAATRYKVNDVVKQGAGSWICIVAHTADASTFGNDVTSNYWDQFVEGFEFENDWSVATTYQNGDVVTYGGNQYLSKTINTGQTPSTSSVNWDIFSEGLKYRASWSISTSYKIGDVVRLNGYTYRALTDSPSTSMTITASNSIGNLYTANDTTGVVANMAIKFSGTTFGGILADATYYVKTVVSPTQFTISTTPGGTVFTLSTASGSMTAEAGAVPPNSSYWNVLNSGIYWKGEWQDDIEYVAGDAVRFGSNAYICVLAH